MKALLKNSSCDTDTAIDGPGPSIQYHGCPNIFDAIVLMKLFTMAPLVLPRALSTVVANNFSKLSITKGESGGLSTMMKTGMEVSQYYTVFNYIPPRPNN